MRQASQERHQQRMKEIEASNGTKGLPDAQRLEIAYNELIGEQED